MPQTTCELIKSSVLSNDLTQEECLTLASICTVKDFQDDDIIFKEGEITHSLFVIVDGKAGVNKEVVDGDDITLHVLKKGDLIGEMSFLDGQPHSVTVKSLGKTQTVVIQRDGFEELLNTHPHLVYKVMKTIIRTSHDIVRKMNAQYLQLNNYVNTGMSAGGYTSGGMY